MYQVLAWFMGRGQSLFLLYRVYMLYSVQLFSATHSGTLVGNLRGRPESVDLAESVPGG